MLTPTAIHPPESIYGKRLQTVSRRSLLAVPVGDDRDRGDHSDPLAPLLPGLLLRPLLHSTVFQPSFWTRG